MKGLILTAVFVVLLIAMSWGMRLAYPPQIQQVGDSLETSILKAEKVYQSTGIWEVKGR
jgi:hypothetical protein